MALCHLEQGAKWNFGYAFKVPRGTLPQISIKNTDKVEEQCHVGYEDCTEEQRHAGDKDCIEEQHHVGNEDCVGYQHIVADKYAIRDEYKRENFQDEDEFEH